MKKTSIIIKNDFLYYNSFVYQRKTYIASLSSIFL